MTSLFGLLLCPRILRSADSLAAAGQGPARVPGAGLPSGPLKAPENLSAEAAVVKTLHCREPTPATNM